MAQYRYQTNGNLAYQEEAPRQVDYIRSNHVKVKDPVRDRQKAIVQKNQAKAKRMSVGYILFLFAAMCMTGLILVGYLSLQSSITNSITHISELESQLNDMKKANDEMSSRIESRLDLEEVRRVAIEDLGMTYAEEGQVLTFSSQDNDYVRQLEDLPQ